MQSKWVRWSEVVQGMPALVSIAAGEEEEAWEIRHVRHLFSPTIAKPFVVFAAVSMIVLRQPSVDAALILVSKWRHG